MTQLKLLFIELHNILAYKETKVSVKATSPERNIVLITGHNGAGKTSFLRAMKILFGGIEKNEEIRSVGFPPRVLNPRQYVLGDNGLTWIGLINRGALVKAQKNRESVTASVAVRCLIDGIECHIRRSWTTDGHQYEEKLLFEDASGRLTGESASERLEDIFPKDYIEFFFFDGEDVKKMAENVDRQSVNFDRLLKLRFVTDLAEEVSAAARDRHRRNLHKQTRDDINRVELAIDRAKRDIASWRSDLKDLEEELATATLELRQLENRRQNLGSGASAASRDELKKRGNDKRKEVEIYHEKIEAEVTKVIPVIGNLPLLDRAVTNLDQLIGTVAASDTALIRKIKEQLPSWLDQVELGLAAEVCARLTERISSRLDDLADRGGDKGLFDGLDPGTAERIRGALLNWKVKGPVVLDAQAALLDLARRQSFELEQLEDELRNIEVGSQAKLEEFKKTVSAIAEISEKNEGRMLLKGSLLTRIASTGDEIAVKERELAVLERKDERAQRDSIEATFIGKIAKTLNDLREALREASRADVQDRINRRFQQLISNYSFIDAIELDQDYNLKFKDSRGQLIGPSSLSSGVKQIAATALLWAMKDASGQSLPIIIDTPLGRIDRENQINLLRHYYPAVGEQVIVLPTSSELDERNLGLLEDHVASRFAIRNDNGETAEIVDHEYGGGGD